MYAFALVKPIPVHQRLQQSVMFVLFSSFYFGQNDTCEMHYVSAPLKLFVGYSLWKF